MAIISRIRTGVRDMIPTRAGLNRVFKQARQTYVMVSRSAEKAGPYIERVGNRELLSGVIRFTSLFAGVDHAALKQEIDLRRQWVETNLGEMMIEYINNKLGGLSDAAKKIEGRIDDLIKYCRIGNGARGLFELSECIKETNAFDPVRIEKNLPLVVAFDGRACKEYGGKEPFELVYVRDDRFEALTGIYGNKNLPSSIIGVGGIKFYPFSPEKTGEAREATRLTDTGGRAKFLDVLFDGGETIIFQTRASGRDAVISSWIKAMAKFRSH